MQGQPCTRGIQGAATDDMNKLAWNAFVIQRASEHFAAHLEQPMRYAELLLYRADLNLRNAK